MKKDLFHLAIAASILTVVHSSDGGVDDFATTALLAAAEQSGRCVMPAVVITNADCEPASALSGYQKMLQLFQSNARVGLSPSRVWIPFPWQWRMDSQAVDQLHCLDRLHQGDAIDGNALLIKTLEEETEVTLIATGPLTTIAEVLQRRPELIAHVRELHWMGGALDVPGNIIGSPEIPHELLNERAEWNVFCDAPAADWIFRNTPWTIHLYPIDLSNTTLPNDFLNVLHHKQQTIYAKFITECYRIVDNVPDYRMWDVVAAAGALFPELFETPVVEKVMIEVIGREQGALVRAADGRAILVYKEFKDKNPERFYEAVSQMLTEN